MFPFQILLKGTSPEFALKAYKEWAQKNAKRVQDIIGILATVSDFEFPDDVEIADYDAALEYVHSHFHNDIVELIESYGINPSAYVPSETGWMRIIELVESTCAHVEAYSIDADTFNNPIVPVYDGSENASGWDSVENFFDFVKTSLHACISSIGAVTAQLTNGSIGDKLVAFRDVISRSFQNAYMDTSNSLDYYTQLIEANLSHHDFVSKLVDDCGIPHLVEDGDITTDTLIKRYTGSTPVNAGCFSAIGKGVVMGGKAIGMAVGAVFVGLWTGVKSIFKKGVKAIKEAVFDPFDAEWIEGDVPSVDGFVIQSVERDVNIPINQLERLDATDYNYWRDILNDYDQGKSFEWAMFRTYFGECRTRISNVSYNPSSGLTYTAVTQYKPYAVNPDLFYAAMTAAGVAMDGSFGEAKFMGIGDLSSVITHMLQYPGDLYCQASSSERDLYIGLFVGAYLLDQVMAADVSNQLSVGLLYPYWNKSAWPNTITNFDFVKLVSGFSGADADSGQITSRYLDATGYSPIYNTDAYNFVYAPVTDSGTGAIYGATPAITFLIHQLWSVKYPTTNEFVPYSILDVDFKASTLRIKTDEDNEKVFTKFAAIVITAIVTIAVAVTGMIVAQKIKRSLWIKRQKRYERTNLKLQDGIPLTKKEEKFLYKYQKKHSMVNAMTSGVQSNTTVSESNIPAIENSTIVTPILNIIQGNRLE